MAGGFFERVERGGMRFAWEPRGDWPQDVIRGLCRDLDLIRCVDPLAAASLHGTPGYYRLHGRGGYRYTYTTDGLRALIDLCRRPLYVMFNNMTMGEDARRFLGVLRAPAPREEESR